MQLGGEKETPACSSDHVRILTGKSLVMLVVSCATYAISFRVAAGKLRCFGFERNSESE